METVFDHAADVPHGPIRDQRRMIGTTLRRTPEEIEDGWREWAETHGLTKRRLAGDYSIELHESRKVVVAYVSAGQWVADCPGCAGGIACWQDNPRGCCLSCGTIYRVDHPSIEEIERVTALFGQRHREADRNWFRQNGETLDTLAAENEKLAVLDAHAAIADAHVSVDDVARILGDRAVEKLQKAGVLP